MICDGKKVKKYDFASLKMKILVINYWIIIFLIKNLIFVVVHFASATALDGPQEHGVVGGLVKIFGDSRKKS